MNLLRSGFKDKVEGCFGRPPEPGKSGLTGDLGETLLTRLGAEAHQLS
jgi:hypothetical protein